MVPGGGSTAQQWRAVRCWADLWVGLAASHHPWSRLKSKSGSVMAQSVGRPSSSWDTADTRDQVPANGCSLPIVRMQPSMWRRSRELGGAVPQQAGGTYLAGVAFIQNHRAAYLQG